MKVEEIPITDVSLLQAIKTELHVGIEDERTTEVKPEKRPDGTTGISAEETDVRVYQFSDFSYLGSDLTQAGQAQQAEYDKWMKIAFRFRVPAALRSEKGYADNNMMAHVRDAENQTVSVVVPDARADEFRMMFDQLEILKEQERPVYNKVAASLG